MEHQKKGKLLKFGNEKKTSGFIVVEETVKSPNILKEMVKCSQDSISQFNKNTVPMVPEMCHFV